MPSYSARQTATVSASPQQCFDALTDYERLPEWQSGLKTATVVESLPDGAIVDYELDAKVRTVRYRLRLTYDEPTAIDGTVVSGDFKRLDAGWRFTPSGDATAVELTIDLDPGRFVPGPVRKLVQEIVMRGAVRDLTTRLEAPSA